MQSKLIIPILLLLFQTVLFSSSTLISSYIPMANTDVKIRDKDGVELRKVLFFTYNKDAKSAIESGTWSYKINTPHKNYKGMQGNLAYLIGLKLYLNYKKDKSCTVTIDKREVRTEYSLKKINKITKYLKKATLLNMKDNNLNCKIKILENIKLETPKLFQNHSFKEEFYPLGWSDDGKLAYILMDKKENSNRVFISAIIKDSVTDKIIWESRFGGAKGAKNINIEEYWWSSHKEIEAKLIYFKINRR